jgi:aspartate kinase
MKVFKFGGASVRSASAIRQVVGIIKAHSEDKILVVVSAMGKTTDALEQIVRHGQTGHPMTSRLDDLRTYHRTIVTELFPDDAGVYQKLENLFSEIQKEATSPGDYDTVYDQVVSLGEIISSVILSRFLNVSGIPSQWIDARKFIHTDNRFREATINWTGTEKNIQELKPTLQKTLIVTQGFIGSSPEGLTTTLGREGSDFSAAIFGSCLQADSVTIWKDVPGVMNADPKKLKEAISFEELPFREAAEMTYYGASIIHPKTIKPLANKEIPLWVKSFEDPSLPGTVIHDCKITRLPPLIVFKENQCLISCKVTDYSFISELQIGIIFQALSDLNIKINVMQNSAISFSFCIDYWEQKIVTLIDRLGRNFEVFYNTGLTLITVKNYDQKLYEEYRNRRGVILEQSSRSTLQVLVK